MSAERRADDCVQRYRVSDDYPWCVMIEVPDLGRWLMTDRFADELAHAIAAHARIARELNGDRWAVDGEA